MSASYRGSQGLPGFVPPPATLVHSDLATTIHRLSRALTESLQQKPDRHTHPHFQDKLWKNMCPSCSPSLADPDSCFPVNVKSSGPS